jgi:DNA-binding NarL/FixJ family response regulator
VLLVDDHAMFREGLRFFLSRQADIDVIGEAGDGHAALDALDHAEADVVVMDLAMPRMDGLSATPQVVARGPRVLVLTLSEDDANVLAALRAGASGYLVKGAAAEQVSDAVRAVAGGQAIFGPTLAARMLEVFAVLTDNHAVPSDPRREACDLSTREREVLELVAAGCTNTEIAGRLVISPITARNHVSNILTKLQLTNRTQAATWVHGGRGALAADPDPPI